MPSESGLTAGAQALYRAIWDTYERNFNQPIKLGDVAVNVGVHRFPNTSNFRMPFVLELKKKGFIKTSWGGHDWKDTLIEPLEVIE